MAYSGYYFNGERDVECTIKRMGSQNTRIILDGVEQLVRTDLVKRVGDADRNLAELILPTIPLESLYRRLRKLVGTKQAKFEAVRSVLSERHGACGSEFLSELFRRSVSHSQFYRNIEESFCPERTASGTSSNYARKLVQFLGNTSSVQITGSDLKLVDFEIFPFRTTYSCTEQGRPASSTASGGMDMLLVTNCGEQPRPVIGEIKADTEVVGPTFALIQALMYASQMATPSQFERLAKQYPQVFSTLEINDPTVEICVFLESFDACNANDLTFARELASSLQEDLVTIPSIRFVQCKITNGGLSCQEFGDK